MKNFSKIILSCFIILCGYSSGYCMEKNEFEDWKANLVSKKVKGIKSEADYKNFIKWLRNLFPEDIKMDEKNPDEKHLSKKNIKLLFDERLFQGHSNQYSFQNLSDKKLFKIFFFGLSWKQIIEFGNPHLVEKVVCIGGKSITEEDSEGRTPAYNVIKNILSCCYNERKDFPQISFEDMLKVFRSAPGWNPKYKDSHGRTCLDYLEEVKKSFEDQTKSLQNAWRSTTSNLYLALTMKRQTYPIR